MAKATASGGSQNVGIARNYFGERWGQTPPNYYGRSEDYWRISWESTDDNYVKYKRPKIVKFGADKVVNSVAYSLTDLPVKSYTGMPITNIDNPISKLKVDLDVHIKDKNTGNEINNANYYFIVSNQEFGTDSSSDIISSGENENIKFWSLTTGETKSINFDDDWVSKLPKGSYLYGRIYPVATDTYAVADIPTVVSVKS